MEFIQNTMGRLWRVCLITWIVICQPAILIAAADLELQQESASTQPGLEPIKNKLLKEFGHSLDATARQRLERGLNQMMQLWRTPDGDAQAFESFVRQHLAIQNDARTLLFNRFEQNLEQIDGHFQEVARQLREPLDLDRGATLPCDDIFAAYNPAAHVLDDWFNNKLAFVAILNFPWTTLEERLQQGTQWTRQQWAEARLGQRFSRRIPSEVNLEILRIEAAANRYVAEYNIYMHHVLETNGTRLFPAKMRLLSHWNLRDEIKACYGDPQNGLAKQRTLQKVMERIVTQTIPALIINQPGFDWDPHSNSVTPTTAKDVVNEMIVQTTSPSNTPEPDTRYATILSTFHAMRKLDPWVPATPNHIDRRFNEDRELSEERVRQMLEMVLTSPEVPRLARLIEQRLRRPLEPFDIWYNGFRPNAEYNEAELDAMVRAKYPKASEFEREIPNILRRLGFSRDRIPMLASHIAVDGSRGSGHAMSAAMRDAKARLRTRFEADGMNYKGYNIALHELGHNVEQVLSLNGVDHTLLQSVPNNAFTEAFAFVFQSRDLQLLGMRAKAAGQDRLKTLSDFWGTFEISGVALVDMEMWRWMYSHPEASPSELKAAVLDIARRIWNQYYAPVFHQRDVVLLGIYSHMVDNFLYLPDYPIGHLIAQQIELQMRKTGSVGKEFERMATLGRVSPDLWMEKATGSPVSAKPMLDSVKEALDQIESGQ